MSLLREVQRCPQVPTAAKVQALNAISRLASSWMIVALFPPNSSSTLPNLFSTLLLTILPILLEPVKETKGTRWSWLIFSPISAPPCSTVSTLGLIPFFLKTSPMICALAMVTSEEAGAPFQVTVFPQMRAMAAFHAKTAFGKLKAVMTPTVPSGFHTSIMKCSFRSELKTCPPIVRDIPQAMSHTSIVSCTSPKPSERILPIYKETNLPSGSFLALKASPICLTISPLIGIGTEAHSFWACAILEIAFS